MFIKYEPNSTSVTSVYKFIIALTLLLALSGCGMVAKYDDISNDPRFENLVGKRYQTLVALKLHGVSSGGVINNMTSSSNSRIGNYILTLQPGFSGRHVLVDAFIPAGFEFTVLKILKCANCLGGKELIRFEIDNSNLDNVHRDIPTYLTSANTLGEVAENGGYRWDNQLLLELE